MTLRNMIRMTQLAIRVDEKLLAKLDQLVDADEFANRSEAVRQAISELVKASHDRRVAATLVESYRAHPVGAQETFGGPTSATSWDDLDDDSLDSV